MSLLRRHFIGGLLGSIPGLSFLKENSPPIEAVDDWPAAVPSNLKDELPENFKWFRCGDDYYFVVDNMVRMKYWYSCKYTMDENGFYHSYNDKPAVDIPSEQIWYKHGHMFRESGGATKVEKGTGREFYVRHDPTLNVPKIGK